MKKNTNNASKSMVGVVEKGNIVLVESSDKVQTTNVKMEMKIIEANAKIIKLNRKYSKNNLKQPQEKLHGEYEPNQFGASYCWIH
jgi:hypothetical protein